MASYSFYTHNLCFEQKEGKYRYQIILSENCHFYGCKNRSIMPGHVIVMGFHGPLTHFKSFLALSAHVSNPSCTILRQYSKT